MHLKYLSDVQSPRARIGFCVNITPTCTARPASVVSNSLSVSASPCPANCSRNHSIDCPLWCETCGKQITTISMYTLVACGQLHSPRSWGSWRKTPHRRLRTTGLASSSHRRRTCHAKRVDSDLDFLWCHSSLPPRLSAPNKISILHPAFATRTC